MQLNAQANEVGADENVVNKGNWNEQQANEVGADENVVNKRNWNEQQANVAVW